MKTFIPKGQWMVGASFSYMEMDVDNYQWLVLEDFNITGYTFKVSPIVSYFIRDNVSIGGRIAYSRSLMDMGNLAISLGDDLNINLSDYYLKSHMVSTSGFVRTYLNLGDSKRFGLFNEARVTYGYGEGNSENGSSDTSKAVHEVKHILNFGISPGMVAFVNNFAAVEVSLDVLGLDLKWYEQTINQVEQGSLRTSSANFKINLFSINLGMTFYF
ncbi:MAG: hypothetical protein LIP06_12655 [Tannerellaceae bacterium]|nr:hypothetical protein [Tannerellaceae bacterium]